MLIVTFHGGQTTVSRHRLLELLEYESAYLALMTKKTAPPPDISAEGAVPPVPASHAAATGQRPIANQVRKDAAVDAIISHASLSARIKKIHRYSRSQRELRPIHAGLLAEILAAFRGVIPPHSNSGLEEHLEDIMAWGGVTGALRDQIAAFLSRYRDQKAAPGDETA